MSDKIRHLTEDDFEEVIEGKVPALVDFWATWCGPCRMVEPVIESLAERYDGSLAVCKVDVDKQQKLALRLDVMSIPTVILFKDGEVVRRLVGALPEEEYAAVIDDCI